MAWKGVITNAGAALLDQWALGGTLTITSAATGTGTVSESALIAQTSLVSGKQTASIISSEKLSAGIKLKLQITAPRTTYLLQQYGVWASLSGGTAVLLALFQNPTGITIPSSTESPDFVYTLFALMKISNTGELTVTVDTSALVSQSTLDEAIASVTASLASHTGNTTAHITAAERTAWNGKYDKTGGTLTGNVVIQKSVPSLTLSAQEKENVGRSRTVLYKNASSSSDAGTQLTDYVWGDGTTANQRTALRIQSAAATLKKKLLLIDYAAGGNYVQYHLYGEHNPPAVAEITGLQEALQNISNSYLRLTGGTLSGALTIQTGGTSSITLNAPEKEGVGPSKTFLRKNASASADYGTQLSDYTWGDGSSTNQRIILQLVSAAAALKDRLVLIFHAGDGSSDIRYHLYGEHNPPAAADVTGLQTALDGKANSSHAHAAEDITSGTLPITRGGTGKTTAKAAANALITELGTASTNVSDDTLIATSAATGETGTWYRRPAVKFWNYIKEKADAVYAAISHTHAAGDITSGTLPAARGGTGQTTLTAAASALNEALASSTTDVQDATLFSTSSVAASTGTWYKRPASSLWNYIKGKADDVYAAVGHNHDGRYYRLNGGTEITSSAASPADLNDEAYRTTGNYYCSTNAAAKTVKHTPGCDATTLVNPDLSAFLLRVGYAIGVSSYISQELRDFKTGVTYYRYYHSSSWTAWQAVSGSGSALLSELNDTGATLDVTDNTLIATSASGGEAGTWYRRTAVKFWNYIKGKADAVYAAISHTHAAGDITSGTLPIARGGTGSTTAFAALTALGGASIASIGTTIAVNTDLNTLITPGTYYSLNSSRSQTMPNTPITSAGFKLIVLYTYAETKVMQLASSSDTFYARYCGDTSAATPTWTAWVKWSTSDHTHAAGDITSGTLPVARGGTGQTTAAAAASALLVALTQVTSTAATTDVSDDTLIATSAAAGETETWYRRPATRFWNYIKGKADAVYSAIGHTHTAASLGGGIATCTTAAATFAKTASLTGYTLKTGGIVVVKFTKGSSCVVSDTDPEVTLNINSTGAKPIKYKDAALDNDTIKTNNYITFVYDGTNYNIISSSRGVANLFKGATASAAGSPGIVPGPVAGDDGKYLKGDGTWAALSAGDITSGTLPVARGGTGNSTGYVTAGQKSGTTLGTKATAEGSNTTASGINAHAEGSNTTASGSYSHAEGDNTTASESRAHAEGLYATASGEISHAEGHSTKASGPRSHAEGRTTEASGECAHAEGYSTKASGDYSHAEGLGTIASGVWQHVFGKYNVEDPTSAWVPGSGAYFEIVGKGSSASNRSNARTLDYTGNEWIAGTLTQASDARLKDVQGEVPDVSGIRAVRFRWNDTNGEHDDKEHIGYIAQDVERIAPFLVGDDSNGYKSLDYIALLCAKVEMLERQVAELESRQ